MSADLLIVIGGVFVAVACLVGLGGFVLIDRLSPERRRLEQLVDRSQPGSVVAQTLSRDGDHVLDRYGRYLGKSPKDMGRLQRQLAKAGYHGPLPVLLFGFGEIGLPLLFGATALVLLGFSSGLIPAVFAAAAGYLLPGVFLSSRIRRYKKQIRNGLADALDLLIVCVEAGSGLDQALIKASDELKVSYPALSSELAMITTEIRAGKPRLEAFKNFAERTQVDDVQSLVSMLVQTDRFGTSIAQALRTHADTMRTKRRQRAEEKAAKLGVKLVFPLVLCLFPALYVVALGPAVIQIVRFFGQVNP